MGNATCKKLCGAHAAAISKQVDVAHIYSIIYVCVCVCMYYASSNVSQNVTPTIFPPRKILIVAFSLAWLGFA